MGEAGASGCAMSCTTLSDYLSFKEGVAMLTNMVWAVV